MGERITQFERDMVAASEMCRAAHNMILGPLACLIKMDEAAGRTGEDAYAHDMGMLMLSLRQIADDLDQYVEEICNEQ